MTYPRLQFDRTAPAELLIEITGRLDEAGLMLARMPGNLSAAVLLDPDLPQEDLIEVMRPSPAQITRMDEALTWLSHLPPMPDARRILVLRRLARSARSGKHRYSWKRLGELLHISNHTAKAWHAEAVELIARNISHPPKMTSNTSSFGLSDQAC